jgi:DNA-binding transcriptional MerR regulator
MLSIGAFARLGRVSPRMLRHYDELGLLKPIRVDPQTAYRSYEVAQLGRLHRLLALRDLGLTLEQIRPMLDDDPSIEELRGMLRLRRAQIEQNLSDETARLRRVEAHLHALEGGIAVSSLDVAIKMTEPCRIAEASATAAGFGHENLDPVFQALVPAVLEHLVRARARPGIMVAWYEEPADDGSVVVHAGFEIGTQSVPDGARVSVRDLAGVMAASLVHRGPMDDIGGVYEALVRWVADSGHDLAGRSRELYHHWDHERPERSVTELQLPLAP